MTQSVYRIQWRLDGQLQLVDSVKETGMGRCIVWVTLIRCLVDCIKKVLKACVLHLLWCFGHVLVYHMMEKPIVG